MNDVEYQSLVDRDVASLLHPQYLSGDQRKAIILAKGEGAILTDVRGREYIDGLSLQDVIDQQFRAAIRGQNELVGVARVGGIFRSVKAKGCVRPFRFR